MLRVRGHPARTEGIAGGRAPVPLPAAQGQRPCGAAGPRPVRWSWTRLAASSPVRYRRPGNIPPAGRLGPGRSPEGGAAKPVSTARRAGARRPFLRALAVSLLLHALLVAWLLRTVHPGHAPPPLRP